MGSPQSNAWRSNDSQQLTFVVTQECNLRCKYCYMTGKNDQGRMSFETAKKTIDYFMDNKSTLFTTRHLILDFIGGEPLLEIELIDKIVDYFRLTAYKRSSEWFGRFRISIQSNGVLVDSEAFQRFLRKNKNLVSLGITIDGTQEKHDLQRVFPNGEGSYSIVEKNYKMAFERGLTNSTKVTFGHEDLKYIKDSIIHLWNMGIRDVPANIVHENVWEEGDDIIYEEQLVALADYVIDNRLWNKYNTNFFMDSMGFKTTDDAMTNTTCGTGSMYCVDSNGDIYNCVRFMEYSLNNKQSRKIGNIYSGVDIDRQRALKTLFPKYISDKKCIDCKVSMNCAFCAGNNYDMSDNGSMFFRSTAICDMHKARVRANNYFWARLYNEHSVLRHTEFKNEYFMYFILSSDCVDYCNFKSSVSQVYMSPEALIKGLEYAFYNFYQPVFVHSDNSKKWLEDMLQHKKYGMLLSKELKRHIVRHIMKYQKGDNYKDVLYVINAFTDKPDIELENPVILSIDAHKISELSEQVRQILPYTSRININISNIDNTFELWVYEKQLQDMVKILAGYLCQGRRKEIRQLTDRLFLSKMNNCFAGEKNITLAPDGNFYFCPAFYFDKNMGIDFEQSKDLTALSNAPICDHCDAYQCNRCVYANYIGTRELNTPTKMQCNIAHLERRYSAELLKILQSQNIISDTFSIPKLSYNDPIDQFDKKKALTTVK